jgi:hypothetical protein
MSNNVSVTAGSGTAIKTTDNSGVHTPHHNVDSIAAGENHLGQIGGSVGVASANFTRPGDTTTYAIGDLIANSTTAGSVAAMQFTVARVSDKSFRITRARVKKSGTSTTNASFRLHLYKNDPAASSGITNGDNGAWSTKEAEYLGAIDVAMDKAFSDAAKGIGLPNEGFVISAQPSSGTRLVYGLLEARAAYTPANAEVFTVVLEIDQD